MNAKLQAVIDALNKIDYNELTEEELQTLDNIGWNEHLEAQARLYRRKQLFEGHKM